MTKKWRSLALALAAGFFAVPLEAASRETAKQARTVAKGDASGEGGRQSPARATPFRKPAPEALERRPDEGSASAPAETHFKGLYIGGTLGRSSGR